jgi:hypothetical protein
MNAPDSVSGGATKRFTRPRRLEPGVLPETLQATDLDTLNSALDFLFSRLREAREQFDKEGDHGRLGAANALSSLLQFIAHFRAPYAESLQVPILRLLDALAMLQQNRVEPILRPVARTGRAPSSGVQASLRGQAAATVQLLLQVGLAPDKARDEVANKLRRLGIRPERGSGSITGITVRHWCEEVSSDVRRQGAAAIMYDMILAPTEQERFSKIPKDQAKSYALQSLAHWVQSLFPESQKPS